MSSIMVVTAAASKTTSLFVDPSPSRCPSCGVVIIPPHDAEPPSTQLLEAQARIAELETQVFQLNQKAAAAVNRWADYEAELSRLRAKLPSSSPEPSAAVQSPTRSSFFQAGATRISALMNSRRSQAVSPPASKAVVPVTPPPPPPAGSSVTSRTPGRTAEDLLEALNKEQMLRRAAEGRLNATNREIEELSATLFEQANEMVATERRARAALEQRVSELEKRDVEKKRRLDKLELAVHRIERVKTLLLEGYDAAALSQAPGKVEMAE
ncbi:tfiid and saga subunit taf61 [Trichoderma cornu-damae]|uniref:Tfiid and saga subunit taf61 n=1 Tax=Trichoderma cornu-damae TaxID=654480 RepID=A0A9P8QRT6_9HYPO|nr:tfiid and saga subunit taf61 [Trichoderma cornu-damae]